MKVILPSALEQFVEERVRAGAYLSESEVVADALRRLIEGDHLLSGDEARRLFTLGLSLGNLKGQLAEVEIQIKDIVQQIEKRRQDEDVDQEHIREAQNELEAHMRNLIKAADAYEELLDSVLGTRG